MSFYVNFVIEQSVFQDTLNLAPDFEEPLELVYEIDIDFQKESKTVGEKK